MRYTALAALFVAGLSPVAGAQTPDSLFNGHDLKGWRAEYAKARVVDSAIRVESSPGWVRTERPFSDFVLTFEIRMRGAGRAGVFVRGWPAFDKNSSPANAFRITKTFQEAESTDLRWERWQVECRGGKLRLLVDGVEAYSTEGLKNLQGFVALWALDGTAEFRAIHIEELAPPVGDTSAVITASIPGAAIPKLMKEVKPAYTMAAMGRQIQGIVHLVAVVEADGSVGIVRVVQSLDPKYGLDESAMQALKGWRFTPATLNGKPVRMLITFQLKFTLK
jgi:TonB family protein